MRLRYLYPVSGDKIRRKSWDAEAYLVVANPFTYEGLESNYDPEYCGPNGMLVTKTGRRPFWISNQEPGDDWEKVS